MLRSPAFRSALAVGPLLVLAGYVVVLKLTDVIIDDRGLLVLVAWPAVAALVLALVAPGHRRLWLSVALGCLAGTALVVAFVVGVISLLAGVLSDPAPPAP